MIVDRVLGRDVEKLCLPLHCGSPVPSDKLIDASRLFSIPGSSSIWLLGPVALLRSPAFPDDAASKRIGNDFDPTFASCYR